MEKVMNQKLIKFAMGSLVAIVIGFFPLNSFSQSGGFENKGYIGQSSMNCNNQAAIQRLEQLLANTEYAIRQWTEYRDYVKTYYNNPTYYRWARIEYSKAGQQLMTLFNSKSYYRARLAEAQTCVLSPRGGGYKSGTEFIYEEIWGREGESPVTIELRALQYDDGTVDRSDYDQKRARMAQAGYRFYSADWSKVRRRRF
jgi:hypothetical protein